MTLIKLLAAATVMAAPLLVAAPSADAATARQYQQQGRGHYVSSKGRTLSRSVYHHGYRPFRHHRRYR